MRRSGWHTGEGLLPQDTRQGRPDCSLLGTTWRVGLLPGGKGVRAPEAVLSVRVLREAGPRVAAPDPRRGPGRTCRAAGPSGARGGGPETASPAVRSRPY